MPLDNADFGLDADRPQPSAVNTGKLWFSTDTSELFISTGSSWENVGGGGGGSVSGDMAYSSLFFDPLVPTILADGSNVDIIGGASAAQMSVSVTNPSATNSMGVVVLFRSAGAQMSTNAYVGAFQGTRSISVSPSDSNGAEGMFIEEISPPDTGASFIVIPPISLHAAHVVPPGGSQTYDASDIIQILGDSANHLIDFIGYATLTAIGTVIA